MPKWGEWGIWTGIMQSGSNKFCTISCFLKGTIFTEAILSHLIKGRRSYLYQFFWLPEKFLLNMRGVLCGAHEWHWKASSETWRRAHRIEIFVIDRGIVYHLLTSRTHNAVLRCQRFRKPVFDLEEVKGGKKGFWKLKNSLATSIPKATLNEFVCSIS